MMVQEHISLRQLLLREEDVLSWYSMPIRQTSSLKRTNPDASRTEAKVSGVDPRPRMSGRAGQPRRGRRDGHGTG